MKKIEKFEQFIFHNFYYISDIVKASKSVSTRREEQINCMREIKSREV